MNLTPKGLEQLRLVAREVLSRKISAVVEVSAAGELLHLEVTPDGVDSWLVRLKSSDVVLYDTGVAGARVTEEDLVSLLRRGFEAARMARELVPN